MITELSGEMGGAFALTNTYEIDGRVSWHPPDVRGTGCANCYFLADGSGEAVLVDTGLTVHQQSILADLDRLMTAGNVSLSLLPLRQGEFDSMCNMVPIMLRYPIVRVYGLFDDGHLWADFRADVAVPSDGPLAANFDPTRQGRKIGRDERLLVGDREIDAFFPPLRLLNTYWLYDRASRTLFTSDSFGHALPPGPGGPFVLSDLAADGATADSVRSLLLETRYWWLAGADLDAIRGELASIFDRHEVERIAPAYGCVLDGQAVVTRHYELLDDSLREAGRMPPRYSFDPGLLAR